MILIVSVLGTWLRCARLDEIAVEHFDEGVYASNLFFSAEEGFTYPQQFLYAPPLLPELVSVCQMMTGHAPWSVFIPGIVFGSLTVPVMWWFVRRWSGSTSGVAAAGLVALNDFHIAMSRSVMTDVPLGFFLLLAVGLLVEGVAGRRWLVSVAGGVATGLAWATKYNGWLPLTIFASGGLAAVISARWMIRHRSVTGHPSSPKRQGSRSKRSAGNGREPTPQCLDWRSWLLTGAVAVGVAALVWSPVWQGLQSVGGYAQVADNHRQYLSGTSGWWPAVRHHEAVQRHYGGWFTFLSAWLSVCGAALVWRRECSTWNETACETPGDRSTWNAEPHESGATRSTWNILLWRRAVPATAALAGAIVLSPLLVLVTWSLIELPARLNRMARWFLQQTGPAADRRWSTGWLAAWLCLAWLCGLLLVTPFYRPYPRLILPLLVVTCIGSGSAIARVLRGFVPVPVGNSSHPVEGTVEAARPGWNSRSASGWRLVWLIPVVVLCVVRTGEREFPAWQTRTDLIDVARRCMASAAADAGGDSSRDGKVIIYVYGEPALFYQLSLAGAITRPVARLDVAHRELPTFVAVGPHAERTAGFAEQFRRAGNSLTLVDRIPYRLSDFVLLDAHSPEQLDDRRVEMIRLFRVR